MGGVIFSISLCANARKPLLVAGSLCSLEDKLLQGPARYETISAVDHGWIEAVYLASRGLIHVGFAAEQIGCTRRHLYRLIKRMTSDGLQGALPRSRKEPPVNRTSDERRAQIVSIYREVLIGYSVSHAARVLRDEYSIRISRETLRKILIDNGVWKPGGKSSKGRTRVHQPRHRLDRFGEMLLVDTTFHEWIPGLGLVGLVVFVDDATSRIVYLGFTETETSLAYMRGMKQYVQEFGLPVSVYADRHAALFGYAENRTGSERPSGGDFPRALQELGIACIRSFSPQSRGRVERAHRTIQDHLPKLLKRRNVETYDQAADCLANFVKTYNLNFSVEPKVPESANRTAPSDEDINLILSVKMRRRINKNMFFNFNGEIFLADKFKFKLETREKIIYIYKHVDGSTTFRYNGEDVLCRPFVQWQPTSCLIDHVPDMLRLNEAES